MKKKFLIPVILFTTLILSGCDGNEGGDPIVYQVTFDLNYEGSPGASIVNVNEREKVSKPTDPVRTNYEFIGWYLNDTGTQVYDFESEVLLNFTLYAKWEEGDIVTIYHDVTFNYNYEGAPTPAVVSVEDGKLVSKPSDPFRSALHKFEHWSLNQDGTGSFSFDTPIKKAETLYAHWSDVVVTTHTVKFDLNFPNAPDPIEVEVDDGTSLEGKLPADPERTSYNFDGWYSSAQSKDSPINIAQKVYADKTYYAHWEEITIVRHAVTLNFNYEGAPDSEIVYVVDGERLPIPDEPTREGFTFDNWHKHPTNLELYFFANAVTESFNLYAHWNIETFEVKIIPQMAGFSTIVHSNLEYNSTVPYPTGTYEKDGYTFVGWSTQSDSYVKYEFSTPVRSSFNIYGIWTQIETVQITLNYNNGGITPNSIFTIEKGTVLTEPNTPAQWESGGKTYTFDKWVDASDVAYPFSEPVLADLVLKATWTESDTPVTQHAVKFYLNYSLVDTTEYVTRLVADGDPVTIPTPPTRSGYNFTHWSLSRFGPAYDFETPVIAGLELYARWSEITYTVTYNYNYVGAPASVITQVAHGGIVPNANASREGYVFLGWCTDAGCGTGYNFSVPLEGPTTLYAKWVKDLIIYSAADHSDARDLILNPDAGEGVVEYKMAVDVFAASKTYYIRSGDDLYTLNLLEGTNYVYYRPDGSGDPDYWSHDGHIYIERHLVKMVGNWAEAGMWTAADSEITLTVNPNNIDEFEVHGVALDSNKAFKFYNVVQDVWVNANIKDACPHLTTKVVDEVPNMTVKFASSYSLYIMLSTAGEGEFLTHQAAVWAENDNVSSKTLYLKIDDWWTNNDAHIRINMWRQGYYDFYTFNEVEGKYGYLLETVSAENYPGLLKLTYDANFLFDSFMIKRYNPSNYADNWSGQTGTLPIDLTKTGSVVHFDIVNSVWTDNYVFPG